MKKSINISSVLPGSNIRQSVFFKIFAGLTFLFVVLLISVILWVNHITGDNNRQKIIDSELARMEAANAAMEQVADNMTASVTQQFWNTDNLQMMLHPDTVDQSVYTKVIRNLKYIKESQPVVKRAYLYTPLTDQVFDSDSSILYDLEQYPDAFLFMIDPRESTSVVCLDHNDEMKVETFLYIGDKRLFLLAEFNIATKIGVIVYELNMVKINAILGNTDTGQVLNNTMIYPLDKNGNPVLDGILDYSEVLQKYQANDLIIKTLNGNRVKFEKDTLYCVGSGELHWVYLSIPDTASVYVSLGETIRAWAPILLILLLLSLLVAAYVIRTIYQPIQHLLAIANSEISGGKKELSASDDRRQLKANEFKTLEYAIFEAADQSAHLSEMIRSAAPEILESVLVRLMSGRNYSQQRLEETLHGIGAQISVDGRFMVASCVIEEPKNRSVTDTEWNLYQVSLRKMISDIALKERDKCTVEAVRMDRYSIALLLAFDEDSSAVAIKREYALIRRSLLSSAEALPYTLWIENGQICGKLTDIGDSYQEAHGKIHYQQSLDTLEKKEQKMDSESGMKYAEVFNHMAAVPLSAKDDMSKTVKKAEADSAELDRFWYRDLVRAIVVLAAKDDRAALSVKIDDAIRQIGERYGEEAAYRRGCRTFLGELSERVALYPLTEIEEEVVSQSKLSNKLDQAEDRDAIGVVTQELARSMCDLIVIYNRRNQFKYVELAKEYIQGHYTDSALSLNDVAEYIGISASYLSELFNENGGVKFTDYLASYRVEKARALLQVSAEAIKTIGFKCGFNSVQNFNRVFKKVTGMTPGQYRDSRKGEGES